MLLNSCWDTSPPKRWPSLIYLGMDGLNPGTWLPCWLHLQLKGHLFTILCLLVSNRAEWPRDKCAPPYYPKFRNGWEPPAEIFRTAPWETEGPTGSPTSPDYRKHTTDDVSIYLRPFVNTRTVTDLNPWGCYNLFVFPVLWPSFLKLIKWVSYKALCIVLISEAQKYVSWIVYS